MSRYQVSLLAASALFLGLASYSEQIMPALVQPAAAGPSLAAQNVRRDADGTFDVPVTNRAQKLVVQKLNLSAHTDYRVSFEMTRVAGRGLVVVDFIGAGYDSNDQEFRLVVSGADAPLRVRRILNSGTPPTEVHLRIFSFDELQFTIRDLRVVRYSPILRLIQWILTGLAIVAASIFVAVVYRNNIGRLRTLWGQESAHPVVGPAFVIFAVAAAGLALTVRNLALDYPFVFGDEGIYTVAARYFGRPEVLGGNGLVIALPNALYLAATKCLFALGDGYMYGARLVNVIWFCLGLLLIYGIARMFSTPLWSAVALIAVAVSPASVYTACIMPESMYFCAMAGVVYVILRYIAGRPVLAACLGGMFVGFASLVKPHALLVVPSMLAALILLKASFRGWSRWKICGLQAGVLVAAVLITNVGITYLLTGHGFNLGTTYRGEIAASSHGSPVGFMASIFAGHAAVLVSLYGAPLLFLVFGLFKRGLTPAPLEENVRLRAFLLLIGCCLGVLLFTTTKYSVSIAGRGVFDSANRLHGRYYFFLLPLLPVVFFAVVGRMDWSRRAVRRLVSLCCGAAAIAAGTAILFIDRRYTMYFIDYPEAFWFVTGNPGDIVFPLLFPLIFTCVPLLVYALGRSYSPLWFGVGCTLLAATGTLAMSRFLLQLPPTGADKAAALFKQFVPEADWDSGLLIVTDPRDAEPFRILFHMPGAYRGRIYRPGGAIPADFVEDDRSWVIVTSDAAVRFSYARAVASGHYRLYLRRQEAAPQETAPPAEPPPVHTVNTCEPAQLVGFHERENWGVWTGKDSAQMVLQKPIQGKVRLRLVAYKLPKNPSASLRVGIGPVEKTITLGGEPRPFELDYSLPSKSSTIDFSGIVPRSPKSLGQGDDTRSLGVAVVSLECGSPTR